MITRSKRPTSYDVARAAGVSQSAVSFVLSGSKGAARIPLETRRRIWAVARKLDYKRNSTGAALRRGYSDTLVVLAVSWDLATTHAQTAISISRAAWKRKLHTNVQVVADEREALTFLEDSLSYGPFGLMVLWDTPNLPRSTLLELKEFGLPIVDLLPSTIDEIPSATADRRQGLHLAVEYLAGLGHTKIAMILDTTERAKTNIDKLKGYREAVEEAGIGFDAALLQETTGSEFEAARQGFHRLYARRPDVTAAICTSDALALGVIAEAKRMGLRIPGDISVIGHGAQTDGTYFAPTLTSLSVPWVRIAEDAVAIIERMRLQKDFVPTSIYEPEQLVIRESTGPPDTGQRK